jgi:hypothetical protein
VPTRKERGLKMIMVARRPTADNDFGGTRYILNGDEVADRMEEFCLRHKIEFSKMYMEDHTPTKQIEFIAQADILMAMHGSVLSLAGFQPPHSITIEVLPTEFQYCLFHHCLSHSERIWVQATKRMKRLDSEEKEWHEELVYGQGKHMRDVPRKFDPSNVLHFLEEAFTKEDSKLLSGKLYLGKAAKKVGGQTLATWFASAPSKPKAPDRKWNFKHSDELCSKRYNKFGDVMQIPENPIVKPVDEDEEL